MALRILAGFIAGVLGFVVFHQGGVGLFHAIGLFPNPPFSMRPVPFLGIAAMTVPVTVSLGFWAGLWGIVIALATLRMSSSVARVVTATLIGAVAATAYGWFVVAPWRGQPIPPIVQHWNPMALWRGPVINGLFGLGAGLALEPLATLIRRQR